MKTLHNLKPGNIYAVHSGVYAGEMLVFISKTPQQYNFLAVPTMLNRNVPKESYDLAWNSDIIKYVEKAPDTVLKVCLHQYKLNEKSNNRRQ
jgi:hypothetical protein